MDYEASDDEMIQYYLDIGAVTLEGVDSSGEIIYAITENAKELAPELWQSHIEHVDKSLIDLYEKGLASIEYNENLEAKITLSPEGYKLAKEYGLVEVFDQDIPDN